MTNHITVATLVHAPVRKVWACWTLPKHITQWNQASPDWHTPRADVDLQPGGAFNWRMEAKDGTMGFDFAGMFTDVEPYKHLGYTLGDGRTVRVTFTPEEDGTRVTEVFQPEQQNSLDLQRQGWQAILDNFKTYVEGLVNHTMSRWEIRINAPANHVYEIMLGASTYPVWTAAFNPTSRYEGSWDKGATIRFLGEHEGQSGGMVARIVENIPGRFVSIQHLGVITGDQETYEGPEIDDWAEGFENYTFTPDGDGTIVRAELTYNADFENFFSSMWPDALARLKGICEE